MGHELVGAAIFAAIENRAWVIAVGTTAPTRGRILDPGRGDRVGAAIFAAIANLAWSIAVELLSASVPFAALVHPCTSDSAPTRGRILDPGRGNRVGAAIFAAIENRASVIAVGTTAPTFWKDIKR